MGNLPFHGKERRYVGERLDFPLEDSPRLVAGLITCAGAKDEYEEGESWSQREKFRLLL